MTTSTILLALGSLIAAGAVWMTARFRRDLRRHRERLAAVDRRPVPSATCEVEIAERGSGPTVLVSHGIFHGCDGGLTAVRSTITDRHVLSPSRFGYLGSPIPKDSSVVAQAHAFAGILDGLGIRAVDVLGISAGTSAAVQMALLYPDRVDHLVVSSGNWPGSATAQAPPGWAKVFYSDGAMWTLRTLVPPFVRQLMGVPRGFPQDDAQAAEIDTMLDSIFPIGPRREGAILDAYESNPAIEEIPLEDVTVPTLIIHAEDDPLASFEAAERAAGRIPNATFIPLESGGHLGLGQVERTRAAIDSFLGARSTA